MSYNIGTRRLTHTITTAAASQQLRGTTRGRHTHRSTTGTQRTSRTITTGQRQRETHRSIATQAQAATVEDTQTQTDDFIARCSSSGSSSLLGLPLADSRCFDACLRSLRVISINSPAPGDIHCTLSPSSSLLNNYGTVHGGLLATLVDVVGTMSILAADPAHAGVSVDINISYLRPVTLCDTLDIKGSLIKRGKRLAFTTVECRRQADSQILAIGRHTKCM